MENDRWVVIHESDVVASQCRSMSADRKPKEAVHLLALLSAGNGDTQDGQQQ